jgi:hypothetical protein
VQALQALVAGQPPGELPPASEELAALIKGAPLWRGEVRSPPAGLITSLQRIANPSTLSQTVLALALWRSGDVDGAQALLRGIIERINDQPAASTILEAIDRQNLVTENGDPEVAVPPSDPEPPEPGPDRRPTPNAGTKGGGRGPPDRPRREHPGARRGDGLHRLSKGPPGRRRRRQAAARRGRPRPRPAEELQPLLLPRDRLRPPGQPRGRGHLVPRALTLAPSNRDASPARPARRSCSGARPRRSPSTSELHMLDPSNAGANAYLNKHDGTPRAAGAAAADPEEPGELLPIKRKNQ